MDHGNYWPKNVVMPVVIPKPMSVEGMLDAILIRLDEVEALIRTLIDARS